MNIAKRFEFYDATRASFKCEKMDIRILEKYEKDAIRSGYETFDAYDIFSKLCWWELDYQTTFSSYANITFLPPLMFSYFLPAAMILSLNDDFDNEDDSAKEGIRMILQYSLRKEYAFDGLNISNLAVVKKYLDTVTTMPSVAYFIKTSTASRYVAMSNEMFYEKINSAMDRLTKGQARDARDGSTVEVKETKPGRWGQVHAEQKLAEFI